MQSRLQSYLLYVALTSVNRAGGSRQQQTRSCFKLAPFFAASSIGQHRTCSDAYGYTPCSTSILQIEEPLGAMQTLLCCCVLPAGGSWLMTRANYARQRSWTSPQAAAQQANSTAATCEHDIDMNSTFRKHQMR
jgi:hypothetical protein